MTKLFLTAICIFILSAAADAQGEIITGNPAETAQSHILSLNELKAQRATLLTWARSEGYLEKLAEADKLQVPGETGIASLDSLTHMALKLVDQMKATRGFIPKIYESITGQTMDGSPAVNTTPVQPDQLIALSKIFANMGADLMKSSEDLLTMPEEIKNGSNEGIKICQINNLYHECIGGFKTGDFI